MAYNAIQRIKTDNDFKNAFESATKNNGKPRFPVGGDEYTGLKNRVIGGSN